MAERGGQGTAPVFHAGGIVEGILLCPSLGVHSPAFPRRQLRKGCSARADGCKQPAKDQKELEHVRGPHYHGSCFVCLGPPVVMCVSTRKARTCHLSAILLFDQWVELVGLTLD